MTAAAYLPAGFLEALAAKKAKKVNVKKLTRELRENNVEPEPGVGPFIPWKETARRYGVTLPRELRELFAIADTWALEDVRWKNATYLRAAPAGWEIPSAKDGAPLHTTFWQRFDWNVFSNMQIWEHFAGLVCIATHTSGGRFYAAMLEHDGRAPVFYMDHETAVLEGCVASSVSSFLRVEMGGKATVPAREARLVLGPEPWDREDGSAYLAPAQPLRTWSPFLARRAEWMVAALAFGVREAKTFLEHGEATCFDPKKELADVAVNEPLALYWLVRAFLLGESDIFEEAEVRAKTSPSPLVQSTLEVLRASWDGRDAKASNVLFSASLVMRRKELAKVTLPRKAKWGKSFSATML